MDYRYAILNGELPLPNPKALSKFADYEVICEMWESLWLNFLKSPNNTTSIPYWADQCSNEEHFRLVIKSMVKHGWLITTVIPNHNWGEMQLSKDNILKFVTETELVKVRKKYKLRKYVMGFQESTLTTATKQNKVIANTGLERVGFALAGNTQFGYDSVAIDKHRYVIERNLCKSMEKVKELYPELKNDAASYDSIAIEATEHYYQNPEQVYTCGNNLNDSRGRAISTCLKKLGNPISSKDFRALLVVTY